MAAPHFADVPETWRHPVGPYRQAPPEFGGEWWMVNPFTGPEPWKDQVKSIQSLPAGFVEIFGPRPKISDFLNTPNPSQAHRAAVMLWEQDLRYFKKAGPPEWVEASNLALATRTFLFWDMGEPRFYEGRYGFMVRFPQSLIKNFETTAWGAVRATHHEVSIYQIRLLNDGVVPEKRHPFVPPQLWPGSSDSERKEA